MLKVDHLTFAYKRGKSDVLHDFSLSLQPGHIYGLLGKNGAGKSTLLYLMSGLLTPKSGNVYWHDIPIRSRLQSVLQEIFIVPEEFDLPAIPLLDYVELNAPFYPKFSKEDLVTYLHYFDLDIDIHLNALSMGQKKKVFMSFALATHTSILLMDEPTNGLDIPGKSQFRKFITSGMTDDTLIIISTHQVRDIDKVLDVVVIMDQSKVLLHEPVYMLTEKLAFKESSDTGLLSEALYSLPSPQGHQLLLLNTHSEETELNLELLFGAVLSHPAEFSSLFHHSSHKL